VRDDSIARNYAEALLELARRHEGLEAFGEAMAMVARLLEEDASFRLLLETPRIPATEKKAVIRKAFEDRVPRAFLNFLLVTVDKRRQRLLRRMAEEYDDLVDESLGRIHVEVTVARPLPDEVLEELRVRLSRLLGKEAIPRVRVRPAILGGVLVRAGDTLYDGTLRRRLERLRERLYRAELPAPLTEPSGG